mgnify:FL=1
MLPSGIIFGFDFHFSKASEPIDPIYGGGVPAITKLSKTLGSVASNEIEATLSPDAYNWRESFKS